jgi:hypothetical protein
MTAAILVSHDHINFVHFLSMAYSMLAISKGSAHCRPPDDEEVADGTAEDQLGGTRPSEHEDRYRRILLAGAFCVVDAV